MGFVHGDRSRQLVAGYHCPETSLGFIAGCGIHELGIVQWGNKSDDTSPIRYEGTGSSARKAFSARLSEMGCQMRLREWRDLALMDIAPHGRRCGRTCGSAPRRWHDLPRQRRLDQRCRGLAAAIETCGAPNSNRATNGFRFRRSTTATSLIASSLVRKRCARWKWRSARHDLSSRHRRRPYRTRDSMGSHARRRLLATTTTWLLSRPFRREWRVWQAN